MSVIRAFIAISLSEEIYQAIDLVMDVLKVKLPNAPLRWAPARNIHLTLKFLGDVSEAKLDRLQETLQAEVSQHTIFEMSVGHFGAFPSLYKPRVLWIGVGSSGSTQSVQPLQAIQAGIESQMAGLGYPKEERAFSPHLTLARVARYASAEEVQAISRAISGYEPGLLGTIKVGEVHLYRSELSRAGAVYTRLFSVRLQ
jgi:2'-5' RNA ligase